MRIRTTILFLCFWGFAHFCQGQEEKFIILYTQGKVVHQKKQEATAKRIFPGLKIAPIGFIRCANNARIRLLYKGKTFEFSENSNNDLAQLARQTKSNKKLGFIARFWDFITDGINNTDDNEQLERYHRKYMEETSGGIRGFAQKDYGIKAIPILSGNIGGKEAQFKWHRLEGKDTYFLQIKRKRDQAILFQAQVQDTTLTLNLSKFAFEEEETYDWLVYTKNVEDVKFRSAPISFSYHPKGWQNIQEKLRNKGVYNNANQMERFLMEAFELEKEHYHQAAAITYQRALKIAPHNHLVKKLYLAFLARIDALEEIPNP